MKGYMYILECAGGLYYVGCTNNLILRIEEHQEGRGANFTRNRLPVKLVYFEEFSQIDYAMDRERQVKQWSRKKKEALIYGHKEDLPLFAKCMNKSHHRFFISPDHSIERNSDEG